MTYLPHPYLCYYLNNQILNILKPSRTIKPIKYIPISMLVPRGLENNGWFKFLQKAIGKKLPNIYKWNNQLKFSFIMSSMSQSSKRCSRKIKTSNSPGRVCPPPRNWRNTKNATQNGSRTVFQHYIPVVKEIHWVSKWHVYFLFITEKGKHWYVPSLGFSLLMSST